ncbi:RDD family protein, partial [Streptomyces sp. NPDC058953]
MPPALRRRYGPSGAVTASYGAPPAAARRPRTAHPEDVSPGRVPPPAAYVPPGAAGGGGAAGGAAAGGTRGDT